MDTEEDADAHLESQQSDQDFPLAKTSGPFCTEYDSYGVYREYEHGKPTITPDQYYSTHNSKTNKVFSLFLRGRVS